MSTGSATRTGQFSDRKEKQKDVRKGNIVAARAVSELVRTSLGPKGMDKMITSSTGDVVITNDGATILNKLEVLHPAAKMFVDLSKAQDVEAGDGTTTVVVMAGGLLLAAENLLDKGVHPSAISSAWLLASQKSESILKSIAIAADLTNRDSLVNSAITSLNSKVISSNSAVLAPLAVDAVAAVTDFKTATTVDLDDIKVIKKLGGTVEDTELVNGLVFESHASHTAGGPTRMQGAKVGLIQFCLSAPKTHMDHSVVVDDYQQIDRILKEERKYIAKLLKPIFKSGCNVLLVQKSILRDAVNDLSLHYLAKKKVMVVRDVERTDIEFISTTLGLTPVADPEKFTADKLGYAELAEEVSTPSGKLMKITGVKNPGRTVSLLVRGSNRLVVDEAERSMHDALCVVRSLVKYRFLLPGGGAPETELSLRLEQWSETIGGIDGYCIKAFARALETVPYTLAENAGLNPIQIVTELRKRHAAGESSAGINVRKGGVTDIFEEKVSQPLLVTLSAVHLATECVRMILKIDDIVGVR